ncbi:MAG TPA: histidine triad nucleotide-binding protein [Caulifigura sp.]|nr:histidine triad nucleotide-binding protein [Caulifigura sp.]
MSKTIFKRIIDGEIKADIVYQDDDVMAFRDTNPQAPVHVLVIPKKEIASIADAADEDAALLGKLMITVRNLARTLGLQNGYRVIVNTGPDGGQTVNHLHIHLMGKRHLTWPPG